MTKLNLQRQRGVGLIEVLVTLLILSTSLIALTALQTRSLQFNHGSYLRSQMNIYAYDILERMRINPVNLDANYSTPLAAFDMASSPASSAQNHLDVYEWRRNIATSFPDGQGGIECDDVDRTCRVTIRWTEVNVTDQEADALIESDRFSTFEYTARL